MPITTAPLESRRLFFHSPLPPRPPATCRFLAEEGRCQDLYGHLVDASPFPPPPPPPPGSVAEESGPEGPEQVPTWAARAAAGGPHEAGTNFAKGVNGQITVSGDWVPIVRKGRGRIGHS